MRVPQKVISVKAPKCLTYDDMNRLLDAAVTKSDAVHQQAIDTTDAAERAELFNMETEYDRLVDTIRSVVRDNKTLCSDHMIQTFDEDDDEYPLEDEIEDLGE